MADSHHVVVDGSNLATEGRTLPSLEQLDEAVRAYAVEDPGADIIVVVDATFEHRVSEAEREEVREAMLNGEVISPPAGAIGRGDAFVLRIAERTGATVLSNDSFQEFHGEHPWLFDEGRLIGGKPVPGVGWIFTPRLPIRGPKSRAATAEARGSKKDPDSAPAKAAELAKAARKAAKQGVKARGAAKAPDVAPIVDTSWPITPAVPPPRAAVDPMISSAINEAVEEALHPPTPGKAKAAKKEAAAPRRGRGKKNASARPGSQDAPAPPAPVEAFSEAAAKDDAEAGDTVGGGRGGGRGPRKSRPTPPPAVNEPLAFINFVGAYPVGGPVEGEVVSFTSHGAMVDVPLPGGGVLHCYIPLTAMGTPPPTKARQMLTKGEVRSFVLAGLDPPRRVAELALPPTDLAPPSLSPGAAPQVATVAVPAKKASKAAKASPPAKKAAKRAAKKAAKKAAPAKKATAAKKGKKSTKKAAKAVAPAPAKKAAKGAKATKAAKAAKKARQVTEAVPAKKAARARTG